MQTVMLVGAVFLAAISAHAQAALPKVGQCPTGFYSSGKYCIPIKDDDKPAMMRAGQCPTGYRTSGKYCVATSTKSGEAILKKGQCPNGYFTSGAYCVKQPGPVK